MEKLTDYKILNEKPYLAEPVRVLDHGIVELVDWHGNDKRIVDAARLSYQKGTKSFSDDEKLIDYLMRHNHLSPLEMCSITFYMEMPLFVMAQLVRHRQAKLNVESARYSVLEDKMFVPEELRVQDATNKQKSVGSVSETLKEQGIQIIHMHNEDAYKTYQELL